MYTPLFTACTPPQIGLAPGVARLFTRKTARGNHRILVRKSPSSQFDIYPPLYLLNYLPMAYQAYDSMFSFNSCKYMAKHGYVATGEAWEQGIRPAGQQRQQDQPIRLRASRSIQYIYYGVFERFRPL